MFSIFLTLSPHPFPPSDRHNPSSSIPVPTKSQVGVSATLDIGLPCHTSSPEKGLRKRANSEADKPKAGATPPPSYSTAMWQAQRKDGLAEPSPSSKHSSSDPTTGDDVHGEAKDEQGPSKMAKHLEVETSSEAVEAQGDACGQKRDSGGEHTGAMNGSLFQRPAASLHCSVEQAEEIMGTEATALGLGLGLGTVEQAPLDDDHCIPVEHAVAVESDEQVLCELEAAGFEEFSRRIYALNENMSSFRRPRKGSDK